MQGLVLSDRRPHEYFFIKQSPAQGNNNNVQGLIKHDTGQQKLCTWLSICPAQGHKSYLQRIIYDDFMQN